MDPEKKAEVESAMHAADDARASADTIAKEAKHSADLAKVMAARAADYAKELKAEERLAALASKKDTTPKGSIDLWPELRLPDAELVAKIRKGECDGCLSELLELAIAHPRTSGKPGELRERGTVMEALRQRGAKDPVRA